ncbi:hypothetical protein QTL95_07865 [Rhizobium sp. S152]|uniref:hypothetical protein n=1 Tax=Rhizobium sp. S152 TaxID=3055038 RepID=UPI0025A9D9B2|nr:hypothetical protein [Rhizobium sp. S152]MDM9625807.1 hypothetical protein [Rhizobium sp. S152]
MTLAPASALPLPNHTCGTCTLCCRLPEIQEFDKPANAWCENCAEGQGCAIYDERPQLCRDFLCQWMIDDTLGPEWEPSISNMMVYRQGPQITVLVDPDYPATWRREPYLTELRRWAAESARDGGYVIVFSGDDVTKIGPPAEANHG